MQDKYEWGLEKSPANFDALTPVDYLFRAAEVYPEREAIIYGDRQYNWSQTLKRVLKFSSALKKHGIKKGDTVAVMLPNTPEMVEAHFAIPLCGAVINAINIRLDAETISFILDHGEADVIVVDTEFGEVMSRALQRLDRSPLVINVDDIQFSGSKRLVGSLNYEDFINQGDESFQGEYPQDEWQSIALNYTSGTTGNPKGVVYSHRGAAMAAISNALDWDLPKHLRYLWILPMFHCNGWTFPWAVALRAGVNICLRKVDAKVIFDLMAKHHVTHYCGAPIVHNLLINAPEEDRAKVKHKVEALVAGAAPPAAMIEGMASLGFNITHVYGLTEVYGPASVCAKQESWQSEDLSTQAKLNARQGVRYQLQRGIDVLDVDTMKPVPRDGETMGELVFRGNITMKGYLKNPHATKNAFHGGWFRTGDLGVVYPDGYVKIKDRNKDIIISGGENISSIEVEDVLYQHPAVLLAAVVAKPDSTWGEVVCAFVEVKDDATVSEEDLIRHCRLHLPGFKVPKAIDFRELPKTSTGKIQKFELRKIVNSVKAIDV